MTIEFEGAFKPPEQSYLASQFSHCRFRLLARSTLSDDVALIRWESWPADSSRGGPRPLHSAPRHATYVLQATTPHSATPSEGSGHAGASFLLVRIDSQQDLQTRYPDQFPEQALTIPVSQRLHGWWLRSLPLLMVIIALVWVALTFWMYASRP